MISPYLARSPRTETQVRAQSATAAAIVRLAQSQRTEAVARSVAVSSITLSLVALVIVLAVTGMARARMPLTRACDCPNLSSIAVPFKGTIE